MRKRQARPKEPGERLYDSTLWNYRRKYVERHGCPWYILSAKHELLGPDTEIETYDLTLSKMSAAKRREWSRRVFDQLKKEVVTLRGKTIEIHAGKEYIEYGLEKSLREAGARVSRPLKGLGIGLQLKWYREYLAS